MTDRLVSLNRLEDIESLQIGDVVIGEFGDFDEEQEFLVYNGKTEDAYLFLDSINIMIVEWNLPRNEGFSKIRNEMVYGFSMGGINKRFMPGDEGYEPRKELMQKSGVLN